MEDEFSIIVSSIRQVEDKLTNRTNVLEKKIAQSNEAISKIKESIKTSLQGYSQCPDSNNGDVAAQQALEEQRIRIDNIDNYYITTGSR